MWHVDQQRQNGRLYIACMYGGCAIVERQNGKLVHIGGNEFSGEQRLIYGSVYDDVTKCYAICSYYDCQVLLATC